MSDRSKNTVQSVAKAFAVLRAVDMNPPELTMAEIASRTDLDRAAFRLIHTLIDLGYLRSVEGSRRFRLTLKPPELGFVAPSGRDLSAHAGPLLCVLLSLGAIGVPGRP